MQKFNTPILFTPGPVSISPRVLAAGSRPMIHHRTPEFHIILDNVIKKMKVLFGTAADVLLVNSSGRGSMEGALRNLFSPGEKILSICNGKFGHMFADIAEACDLDVHRIFENWLQPVILEQVDAALKNNPDIKGVTAIHSDTSTAVINPIWEIGSIVRRHDRLLLVDCISSLAAMEFKFDEWEVDVAITASQKGLMTPTGLSFVAINHRGWAAVEKATKPGYYINFKNIKKFYDEKCETPGSTPVSLVVSVNESLEMIFEEGLENVYHRHAVISQAIKSSLQAMGLTLLPEGDVDRSHSVTVFKIPEGIKPATVRQMAKDKYGILIASGHSDFKEIALRIGHLGMITTREALLIISALELIFFELGVVDKPGKGLEILHASLKNAGW
ncbi:MAG: alanine--glyoxylate aminotransferase family protein [Desulfobacterales bacterium]|nr:MAG: alanine--glyoxylate aminotransferase family protein [Desulfobacterales bacterium]